MGTGTKILIGIGVVAISYLLLRTYVINQLIAHVKADSPKEMFTVTYWNQFSMGELAEMYNSIPRK